MALYNHLPIYKQCYDFLLRIISAINNFPRDYKYTLGEKIQNVSIDIIVSIYQANSAKNKIPHLQNMLTNIQMLYLFLRISHDLKILSTEKYANFIEMTDNISRQAQGWLSSTEKLPEPDQVTV